MPISLPPELEAFAHEQIDTGKYGSMEEMLVAGVQLLAERDALYQGRFEELRRDVRVGVEAAQRGELLDLEPELDRIRQTIHHRYADT